MKRAALVVNVHSRSGRAACTRAAELLPKLGVPLGSVYPLDDAARLPATASAAVDDGHDLIIVGGGDGTVSSVVDVLAHRHVPMGLLPLGTANDFARTLHIPAELDKACRTIAEGTVVDIDLGLSGDNYYVNRASVGIGSAVARAMSPVLKKRAGVLAYPVATARALLRHKPFPARLTFPDGDHETCEFPSLLQISVANGRYFGGGQLAAADSGIDDNMLDISVMRQGNVRELARLGRDLMRGGAPGSAQVRHIRTSRVHVHTEPGLPINVDGEIHGSTPRTFSVARDALHVIVPHTWTDGSD